MQSTPAPAPPLARLQAAARILRDLCIGASAVWLVLGVPAVLATAIEHSAGSGVDTTEALRQEAPMLGNDDTRERKLREGLDPGKLSECFDRVDLGAFKNTQRLACLLEEQKRVQAILDAEAAKLRESLEPRALSTSSASHRAWAGFRDRWCELDSMRNQAPTPRFNQVFCSIELTREYIVLLRRAG